MSEREWLSSHLDAILIEEGRKLGYCTALDLLTAQRRERSLYAPLRVEWLERIDKAREEREDVQIYMRRRKRSKKICGH